MQGNFPIAGEMSNAAFFPTSSDSAMLASRKQLYRPDIERLQRERGYQSADLVALKPTTPNLDGILAKFTKEHHHTDDEVRFTVAGEGVFEIATFHDDFLKFTAEPGDLIVIPAYRRHSFYLTAARAIRCIRLFETSAGWEAIYEKNF